MCILYTYTTDIHQLDHVADVGSVNPKILTIITRNVISYIKVLADCPYSNSNYVYYC